MASGEKGPCSCPGGPVPRGREPPSGQGPGRSGEGDPPPPDHVPPARHSTSPLGRHAPPQPGAGPSGPVSHARRSCPNVPRGTGCSHTPRRENLSGLEGLRCGAEGGCAPAPGPPRRWPALSPPPPKAGVPLSSDGIQPSPQAGALPGARLPGSRSPVNRPVSGKKPPPAGFFRTPALSPLSRSPGEAGPARIMRKILAQKFSSQVIVSSSFACYNGPCRPGNRCSPFEDSRSPEGAGSHPGGPPPAPPRSREIRRREE